VSLPRATNHLCTSRTAGREIDRSEYADAVEENNKRYQENCTVAALGRRLTYIWHIKRQWGYNHTNFNGLEK
jgi:hypothetical protein